MCSRTKANATIGAEVAPVMARINGRPVLQPTCNRVPGLDGRNSFQKISPKSPPPPAFANGASKATKASLLTPPISPKSKSPRPQAIKRGSDNNGLNWSSEKIVIPKKATKTLERNKSKSFKESLGTCIEASLSYSSSLIVEAPGSIAAVRREQMAHQQAQRKMKIAHYGRSKSFSYFEAMVVPPINDSSKISEEEKRCSFITPNSDPIYVAYHDREWGVPVHDDKMLFELLVLSGAQVGSDWTSILKKRQEFRNAFSEFDAETIANFSDKHMVSISTQYGIDISTVRGVADNSNRILEIAKDFGSFDKYLWGFVNHKAISTQYKFGHKVPVKTSKSESISKDMVRRGFRLVGPTVVHSFMQAAGLTNDHLITCHRHLPCTLKASSRSSEAPVQSMNNLKKKILITSQS
ncbi:Adenine_glyco domain-containing protein [Cephalotus follicularis]|uniref:Adenine_glyco domain-containing protein n=1 Tax=Cephalotus follicularis TaxID=3775 RepID=A0A1Q3BAG3_CEPFO|nr:Adenine_glyco domain-containing protein [Cephalotus follicularis]